MLAWEWGDVVRAVIGAVLQWLLLTPDSRHWAFPPQHPKCSAEASLVLAEGSILPSLSGQDKDFKGF